MTIETKFDIGDKVYFFECGSIQSGIIDMIRFEKTRYYSHWIYEFTDGYRMVNPALYKSEEELRQEQLNLK